MRIVVRAHDARVARDAQARLAAAGIDAVALSGPARPAPDGEDVVIFADQPIAAASHIRVDQAPLATLLALPSAHPHAEGLLATAPGAIAIDAPAPLLAAQLRAWIRVAVLEEERARRAATAAALAKPSPAPPQPRKLKALYVGAPSAMFLALERALARHGGLVAAAFSSYAGFDHLHDEPFDAVVLNGVQDSATAISLCAALRRNASLYHLPTMMLTSLGDLATGAAAIDRGAAAVVAVNESYGPSLGWLFEAIRRDRRRHAAEHEIRALGDVMGEARTGLFQRTAFDAHLTRLAGDHHRSGRPLALAALRVIPAHGARAPSEQVWTRGFDEVASLAARLMRETDAGAAIGQAFIVVALPATRLKGAKRTAERIAAVAECTAFASGEGGAGPLVFEQSAVELQPGESGAGLLARALRALDAESVPA